MAGPAKIPEAAPVTKQKNKVIYGGETLIDLTGDTITYQDLREGVTAHDASGSKVTGNLVIPEKQTKTVDLSMESGKKFQIITPDSGKVLSQVSITKPSTMLPENIKKDVDIGGIVGTLESGGSGNYSEVWVFDELADASNIGWNKTIRVPFISNGVQYNGITNSGDYYDEYSANVLLYDETVVARILNDLGISWLDENYQKLIFNVPITEDSDSREIDDMYSFLASPNRLDISNAIKQPSDQAIQTDKSITITQNGTNSVTPDVPYDALSKVDLTVDVDIPIKETWVWNSSVNLGESNSKYSIDFESNGETYGYIRIDGIGGALQYCDKSYTTIYDTTWIDSAYRKITFLKPPTGYLLTFLQANATKQPPYVALQPSKSVEITANGTTTVTPDVPYDGLQSVEVVANVASSGGGTSVTWYDSV